MTSLYSKGNGKGRVNYALTPLVIAEPPAYDKAEVQRAMILGQAQDLIKRTKQSNAHFQARRNRARVDHHAWTVADVLAIHGASCWVCGEDIDLTLPRTGHKTRGLHIDHLIPLAKGGSDKVGNLRPTHGVCNMSKQDNIVRVNLMAVA